MLLLDKIAWVTGASKGIGRATAKKLASEGATVIISGRNVEDLSSLSEEIVSLGYPSPEVMIYDVSDHQQIKEAFKGITKKYKQLDIMVNNAGILEEAIIGMYSEDHIQRTMSINLHSVILHMQYASRLMMRVKNGSIINLSSIIGVNGKEGLVVYSASKAAVIGASLSAAKELAPFNIRVNAVAPGFIETDMVNYLSSEKYEQRISAIKMKRAGLPDEVANVILFLGSSMSSYVTGQVIGVDGGMLE